MGIALSHGGSTIYSSRAPSRELLVGTAGGVVLLEREAGAGGWHAAHRALEHLHISAIVMAGDLIFAGAFQDSVHVSADGGRTWEPRGDGIDQKNVYSLAAVPRNGGLRLYAGTQPAHLFYSDDFGRRWTELPGLRAVPSVPKWYFPAPPHQAHVKHVVPDPSNPAALYACIEQGALLRSADAGQSWQELHGFDEDVHFLVIDPRDSRRMCMTGGNGVYATGDAGATWEHLTHRDSEIGGYPDTLVFRPRQPELLFLGAAGGDPAVWRKTHVADARVSRSGDGGRTWKVLGDGISDRLPGAIEAMCLEDWGDGFLVCAGTTAGDVYASEDGGQRWTLIASGLPAIAKEGHDRALRGR